MMSQMQQHIMAQTNAPVVVGAVPIEQTVASEIQLTEVEEAPPPVPKEEGLTSRLSRRVTEIFGGVTTSLFGQEEEEEQATESTDGPVAAAPGASKPAKGDLLC